MLQPVPEMAGQIAQEAVDFVEQKFGFALPYTPASLVVIDKLIDKIKETGASEEQAFKLLFALGCYVGEVFVRHAGANWQRTEDVGMTQVCSFPVVVELPGHVRCNPIGKVFKRFHEGESDSLAFFYHATLNLPT